MPPLAPLAVSMGDPAGIGPEITMAAWALRHEQRLPVFAAYGDAAVYSARAKALDWDVAVIPVATLDEATARFHDGLPVIEAGTCGPVVAGQPSQTAARATIAAIDAAVAAVLAGQASAIVTCPIAKSVLYEAGFRHPGHTEYLAYLAERHAGNGRRIRPVMMLACDALKVVPATIHIPLSAVPSALTADLLRETIIITAEGLRRDFGRANPRIAVAGLNPHAGENGTIGREDIDLIAPVIAGLNALGHTITGPHPADTLFHATARTRYDAVVAMYHDQALIPIKTLAFDSGVNVTLGLPFIRTSPDHGTAFDIAGTGTASPESLIQAMLMAAQMVAARHSA